MGPGDPGQRESPFRSSDFSRESPSTFCPQESEQVMFSGDMPSLKMWFHSPRATGMHLWVSDVGHQGNASPPEVPLSNQIWLLL